MNYMMGGIFMIEKIYEFQVLNAIKDGKVIYAIDFFEKRIVNLNIQEISKVFDYIRQAEESSKSVEFYYIEEQRDE